MAMIHRFDPPERFVAGTVGPPGQRAFFLQAREGARVVSVGLEKQQVAILAERVGELLDELLDSGGTEGTVPALTPVDLLDNEPLDQPVQEEFKAGTITLSWDPTDERIVIEVFSITAGPDEDGVEPEPDELFVVRLPSGLARAFSSRAATVVDAGRAQCQFCGGPMDPEGHLCPRANGFRRSADR